MRVLHLLQRSPKVGLGLGGGEGVVCCSQKFPAVGPKGALLQRAPNQRLFATPCPASAFRGLYGALFSSSSTLTLPLPSPRLYPNRRLVKLDSVQFILSNHTPENFPFLNQVADTRHRTTFYTVRRSTLTHTFAASFPLVIFPHLCVRATGAHTAPRAGLSASPGARPHHGARVYRIRQPL